MRANTDGREKGKRIGPIRKDEKETGPGAWCYNARIEKNLTIADLAKKAHVSVRTIKRIEAGEPNAGWRYGERIKFALKQAKRNVFKVPYGSI